MPLGAQDRQILIRIGADISDLKSKLRDVTSQVSGIAGIVTGGEGAQERAVGRSREAFRRKSLAVRDVGQAMTATLAIAGLLGRGNDQLTQTVLSLVAALNGVPQVLRLIGTLMTRSPVLGWIAILAGAAIVIAQATGLLDKLAAKLGLVTQKTYDATAALKDLYELQGKTREARVLDIRTEQEKAVEGGMDPALAAAIARVKIAALDKQLADQRVAIIRDATAKVLEVEGRTHQIRLQQIEQERQEYIKQTGNRLTAEMQAQVKILAAERELAARRAALFTESRQAYLEAIGATTAAELEAVRARLEQRQQEIDAAVRAEVVSATQGQELIIEADRTAAAQRLEIARKFNEQRTNLYFDVGQKALAAAKATMEQELLAIEKTRQGEIAAAEAYGRQAPEYEAEAARLIAYINATAATQRVQIFADSIKRMKDNLATLQAAYQQTMTDLARIDIDLAEKRARLAGRSEREINQQRIQMLQATAAAPGRDPQQALQFNRELQSILAQQAEAAEEAESAAKAAFAMVPTAENAQALQRATVARAEAQRQLTASQQQEEKTAGNQVHRGSR